MKITFIFLNKPPSVQGYKEKYCQKIKIWLKRQTGFCIKLVLLPMLT